MRDATAHWHHLGDPAGIGPEIVRAALASGRLPESADYDVIGESDGCSLGQPTPETARAAPAALEEAPRSLSRGETRRGRDRADSQSADVRDRFQFPGQTEFFAARCRSREFRHAAHRRETHGRARDHAHSRCAKSPTALNQNEIVRVGLLLANFLRRRQIEHPRIAVAGLNPHAGESGALGREEIEIIAPAIARIECQLATRVPPRSSPARFSPDTIFHRAVDGELDGVLCMYHDQGLIPLKLHAFHEGVNVTLGLPFPRTSPDHGTAFEIAGKGIARPDSMIAAIRLAVELAQSHFEPAL